MRLIALILAWLAIVGDVDPASAQGRPAADAPYITGQQTSSDGNIKVELVSLSQGAASGSTAIVALRQQIAPGWHTYWRNPGDSGGATTLSWALPRGVEAGQIVWPLPERQRLLDLVNYGYSGTVYLPVPIQIPAQINGSVRLNVEADLFVCSAELCIPETFRLALDLPVREGAAPDTSHAAAIQAVLASAPRAAGIEARVTQSGGVITLTATGGSLAGSDPGAVWFYPYESGQIAHSGLQSGQRGPQGLTLVMTASSNRADTTTTPIAGVLQTARGAFEIKATAAGAALQGATGQPLVIAQESDGARADATGASDVPLWQALLLALAGGLILNLMPCVFPILAMKAAALTAAAHDPRTSRRDGLLFLIGVLATFGVLAGTLLSLRAGGTAIGWGFQLQSPAVTTGLALLMLAVGLNLSGVFHIGGGLQGLGSGPVARAPGGVQAFLTGILAVVVAAPCTAPFMAVALGAALVMPWPAAMAVFLALGLGLALPYLVVSLSPGLLSRLPRPGAWMERLRGLLAFPMYGAALWLVWVATRQIGVDGLAPLFGAGLTLALALWLYGVGQAGRAWGGRGRLPLGTAAAALVLSVGLAVAAARTPPAPTSGVQGQTAGLPSQPWSPEAVQTALSQGRPVMVDFTADWCVTCKINERGALGSRRVAEAMTASNAVFLVADWTRRDDAIASELQRHGRSGVPLYLIYTPGEDQVRILPQLLTEGLVVEALEQAAGR